MGREPVEPGSNPPPPPPPKKKEAPKDLESDSTTPRKRQLQLGGREPGLSNSAKNHQSGRGCDGRHSYHPSRQPNRHHYTDCHKWSRQRGEEKPPTGQQAEDCTNSAEIEIQPCPQTEAGIPRQKARKTGPTTPKPLYCGRGSSGAHPHGWRRALASIKKVKVSTGVDTVSYRMLKEAPESFLKILLDFFQRCRDGGTVPAGWKHAIVVPIQKHGKPRKELGSYRPISLTSNLGKVYERVIKNRLEYHCESKKVFPVCQADYRRERSVTDHLVKLGEHVVGALGSRKGPTDVLL